MPYPATSARLRYNLLSQSHPRGIAISRIESLSKVFVLHLLKLKCFPKTRPASHWKSELTSWILATNKFRDNKARRLTPVQASDYLLSAVDVLFVIRQLKTNDLFQLLPEAEEESSLKELANDLDDWVNYRFRSHLESAFRSLDSSPKDPVSFNDLFPGFPFS